MTYVSIERVCIYIAGFILLAFGSISNTYSGINKNEISYIIYRESVLLSPTNLKVDSIGNLYIATHHQVNVYNSTGQFLYAIKVTNRGGVMRMRMLEDGNLSIALNRHKVYLVTPRGALIEKKEDPYGHLYSEYIKYQGKERHVYGSTYRLTNIFGYTRVVKYTPDGNKGVVFTIPFHKWLLKALYWLFYLVLLPFIVIFGLIKSIKKNSKGDFCLWKN